MQKNYDVKRLFPFFFTLEMIKHTGTGELVRLDRALKKKENFRLREARKKEGLPRGKNPKTDSVGEKILSRLKQRKNVGFTTPELKPITVPNQAVPHDLEYLKPPPAPPVSGSKKLNLGKLSVLISDPGVKTLECTGSGRNVMVSGNSGIKRTGIILNGEEIEEIIKEFCTATRIPFSEGDLKIISGKLVLTANVSDGDSGFKIQKINPVPGR